ncbi:transcriptional regulator, TetR family [Spongiibacter sp. IMCC21906]|jgi:AcrR family transcriptional regulator|nr:transcriptional regulator, TetR family [Spongiibacter sp. IMCC21906]
MPVTKSKKSSSRSYHHGDLHRQLVEAAARLLREEGDSALSMRRLAQELQVSRMAPYHHFADKHALLCAVAEEGFQRLLALIESDDFLNGRNTEKEGLRRFLGRYITFALDNREYYDLMFGERLWKNQVPTDSLRTLSRASFKQYVERLRQLPLSETVQDDALRYAQVSWSTLHGMSRVLIDGIYFESDAVNAMCDTATEMMWRAFKQA